MTTAWDIFGDEKKMPDGSAKGIGLLVLEAGVVCQFAQELTDEKTRLQGKGDRIGSVHWAALKDREADLACRWMDRFFQGPLMFFVYVPVGRKRSTRLDLVRQAIERLEKDPHIPAHGLHRGRTTLHLDYDNQDARELHLQLVLGFGLLRAFHWSDRDSPLLQLTDLLLGVSERERASRAATSSRADRRRQKVLDHARTRARQHAQMAKHNWVLCYEPGQALRRLLV